MCKPKTKREWRLLTVVSYRGSRLYVFRHRSNKFLKPDFATASLKKAKSFVGEF